MIEPRIPEDEYLRLETLRTLNVLDTEPEERFDRLTRMAKRMFGVPIALVSLVDENRQWFKSRQGLELTEGPRNTSFCGHAILNEGATVVPDARADERFRDNPLVVGEPYVRFYAGCPLRMSNGCKLGTLCLIDHKPRNLVKEDLQLLEDLTAMVEREITAVQLATRDELTLISNRRGFASLAEQTLHVCKRKNLPVTLLVFDLNRFKFINDTFGHAEGDRALVTFANLMRNTFRNSDVFARMGGDEFAALLTDTDEKAAEQALNRFAKAVEAVNLSQQREYTVEYSVGSVSYSADCDLSIDQMQVQADTLMYQKKRSAAS